MVKLMLVEKKYGVGSEEISIHKVSSI
jgi:hypothetical protein